MYCNHCGTELQEGTRFCHICGKQVAGVSPQNQSTEPAGPVQYSSEALIRRANEIINDWNIYPELLGYTIPFDYARIQQYDPLYRLAELKKHIFDVCMKVTQYQYDKSEFVEVVNASFGKRETMFQKQILKWFIDGAKSFATRLDASYHDLFRLQEHVHFVFLYAYSTISISCKLHDCNGLLAARNLLHLLEVISCEKNNVPIGLGISSSGLLLAQNQFRNEKAAFDSLMKFISKTVEQHGTAEQKEQLAAAVKREQEVRKKDQKSNYWLTLVKVLACVLQPFACVLALFLAEELGLPEYVIETGLPFSLLMIVALSIFTNVRVQKLSTVIFFFAVYTILFCPLCFVVSYAIVAVILFAIVAVLAGFRFIRS